MPITFTAGLTPTFPENSFGSEKTHVKQLGADLIAGTAFKNPLAGALSTLVARIDIVLGLLAAEINAVYSEKQVILNRGFSNLPQGWQDATTDGLSGYTHSQMSDVYVAMLGYHTSCTTLQTNLNTLKNYVIQVDVDNFKLHNDLLCGLDDAPPQNIEKPSLIALMGIARSVTDLENTHGITFTNYLIGLFNTLFTADTTIAIAQTHLNTDPLSAGTYAPLNVLTNVDKAYVSSATGDALPWNDAIVEPKVNPLKVPVDAYNTPIITTHKAALENHVTTDMAYYRMVLAKIKSYVQAYQISGHIQDPYYRFMYTDVFGHDDIQQTITDFTNGDID